MSQLKVESLDIYFGKLAAVDQVSFTLQEGEIGCLLGPSGCGKTSLLRCIAGFEDPAAGRVQIAGNVVSEINKSIAPENREVGMVFQDFALFPHLSVRNNIAFGLVNKNQTDTNARVTELLELIGLADHINKYPHELSGGQQQRVALARAMAPRPKLLLLDEPFGSQDAERRESLAHEIRTILKREHVTALLVTHDQLEAFDLADVIGVMSRGKLHQWGKPYDLYHEPENLFVADFIGRGTLIPASIEAQDQVQTELGVLKGELTNELTACKKLQLLVRPDDVIHDDDSNVQAKIIDRSFRGADFLYTLELPSGDHLLCFAPSHHDHAIGQDIGIRLDIEHLVLFPTG